MPPAEYDALDQLVKEMKRDYGTADGKGAVAAIWVLRQALVQEIHGLPEGTKINAAVLEHIMAGPGTLVHMLPKTLLTSESRSAARALKQFKKRGLGKFYLALAEKPSS